MPKRIGYLYEQVVSEENCIQAVIEMTKDKLKNRKARWIRNNAESYGKRLVQDLQIGYWQPTPYLEHLIYDTHRKKERKIRVPCLRDQAVHHAVIRVMAPYVLKRNYYYNCGSIPKAGQHRATEAVKRWMRRDYKYCAQFDVKKFYDSCSHDVVMNALTRIFKDKRFLDLNRQILDSMGEGLAIGFYPAQWYANIVLSQVDKLIKQECLPKCKYVRYMDDMLLLYNNRRHLKRIKGQIHFCLTTLKLQLKHNWQVFRTNRGINFLSYRFFPTCTLLQKPLMCRISRKARRAGRTPSPHNAKSIMSYLGILKYCNSYNFRQKWIYPVVSIPKLKGVISRESKFCSISASS